jgi:F0F1-type ATP synthase assembly protein I
MSIPHKPGEAELQQRLDQLIEEQEAAPPPANRRSSRLIKPSANPITLGLAVMLALMIGLQIGALPWRYRREIWQIQGAVVGLALGVLIGRFSAQRPEP